MAPILYIWLLYSIIKFYRVKVIELSLLICFIISKYYLKANQIDFLIFPNKVQIA